MRWWEIVAGVADQPLVAVGRLPDRTLKVGETAVVEVAGAFSDPDDTLTYAASSSDAAVATASVSGSRVTLTPVAAGRATITVTATAGGGTGTSVMQRIEVRVWTGTSIDYDEDYDGLIEIMTLAQLDAVRYDLDGNGLPDSGAAVYAAAFPHAGTGMGCLTGCGCTGYELGTDLDFDTNGNGKADGDDAYWSYGAGWDPLGEDDAGFSAIFEGNEHIVRHPYSERAAAGLFRKISAGAVIRRVGLIDVDLTGVWNREEATVGGLVASQAGGVIHASYVTGHVTGTERVGGLVGESSAGAITASYAAARVTGNTYVGGLVGINGGEIAASYATGRVAGNSGVLHYFMGGLVGSNLGGIRASYATGHVEGVDWDDYVGGLAGINGGEITASYATGHVTGGTRDGRGGGLVGRNQGSVVASYWDAGTTGHTGRTTAELQAPTGYSGIYAAWNVDLDDDSVLDDPWDFGTETQYPALAVDVDGDGQATWQEFGYQLREGPALTTAGYIGDVLLIWTAVDGSHWNPPPAVTYTVTRTAADDVWDSVQTVIAEESGAGILSHAPPFSLTFGCIQYQVSATVLGGPATHSALLAPDIGNRAPEAETFALARTLRIGGCGVLGRCDRVFGSRLRRAQLRVVVVGAVCSDGDGVGLGADGYALDRGCDDRDGNGDGRRRLVGNGDAIVRGDGRGRDG